MDIVPFEKRHLDGMVALTAAEGWPSLSADRGRASRVMLARGVVTVVAVDDGAVIGYGRALCDGEWVAALVDMVVAAAHRRRGVGRAIIAELFRLTAASRMDLLAEPGSESFYESLPHRRWVGYRLYPEGTEAPASG